MNKSQERATVVQLPVDQDGKRLSVPTNQEGGNILSEITKQRNQLDQQEEKAEKQDQPVNESLEETSSEEHVETPETVHEVVEEKESDSEPKVEAEKSETVVSEADSVIATEEEVNQVAEKVEEVTSVVVEATEETVLTETIDDATAEEVEISSEEAVAEPSAASETLETTSEETPPESTKVIANAPAIQAEGTEPQESELPEPKEEIKAESEEKPAATDPVEQQSDEPPSTAKAEFAEVETDTGLTASTATTPTDIREKEESEAPQTLSNEKGQPEEVAAKASEKEQTPDHPQEHHEEEHHEEPEEDYTKYSKEELYKLSTDLLNQENVLKAERVMRIIKPLFDAFAHQDRSSARKRYLDDGGEADGFEYKTPEIEVNFNLNYDTVRERKSKFYKDREVELEDNLAKKHEVLEKLRHLLDGEETVTSINALKTIQEEWRAIGPIPKNQIRSLWANYNALIDRFYDNRSIYFELKELDRRKNLESKLELVKKAEELAKSDDIKTAVIELNHLHEEFKHIGPVPRDDQERVWKEFKAASDQIYAKRKEFSETVKHQLKDNLDAKLKLAEELETFLSFDSDKITEWNAKTKEILEFQKRWEQIGGLPRDKAKEVNKKFWSTFKKFFSNKNAFFKQLESQREANLELKEALVVKAEELKESDDWETTAERLKELQKDWKNIGPVPEKMKEDVYRRFKAACDEFFNRKRGHNKEVEVEFEENLKQKEAIIKEIEEMAANGEVDVDKVYQLQADYSRIGFVPRRAVKSTQHKYQDAIDHLIEKIDSLDLDNKEQIKHTLDFNKLKTGPNAGRRIQKREGALRKQISNLENDISTWRNNLEFFASSKTADKLKKEFDVKIEKAQKELAELKSQLKVLRKF